MTRCDDLNSARERAQVDANELNAPISIMQCSKKFAYAVEGCEFETERDEKMWTIVEVVYPN
jgi:hypothetical protein